MKRIAPFVTAAALLTAPHMAAADDFSPSQKSEIESIVQSYLLENPEILPQMIEMLQTKQARQAIAAAGPALYSETGGILIGPADAKVTIVEFYDYQCGYCRRSLDVLERVMRTEKDVNILFRQAPIRDKEGETYSYDAAVAALAGSRQKKNFLKFHKALYDSPSRLSSDRILKIAQDADLDIRQFKKDLADPNIPAALQRNLSVFRMLGLEGTPGYVIGDTIIPGFESYQRVIAAVKRARNLTDKG